MYSQLVIQTFIFIIIRIYDFEKPVFDLYIVMLIRFFAYNLFYYNQ